MIAGLESGIDAFALSTGMAAITLLMELFRPGDHLIVEADLYGGSIRLFDHVNKKNNYEFTHLNCAEDDIEGVAWFLGIYTRVALKAGYINSFADFIMPAMRRYYKIINNG